MDSLPEDLTGLLAALLVPRLDLADLQALHQTCCSCRSLTQAATPCKWDAAAAAHGFRPGSSCLNSKRPYNTYEELAACHAAVSSGPSRIYIVRGCGNDSRRPDYGTVEELALHPDFEERVSTEHMQSFKPAVVPLLYSSVTPVEAVTHAESAMLQDSLHRPLRYNLYGEYTCSPDGHQILLYMPTCCHNDQRRSWLCLHQLEPRTLQHRHVALTGYPQEVTWAPDSRSFAVSSRADEPGRYQINVDIFIASRSAKLYCTWQVPESWAGSSPDPGVR